MSPKKTADQAEERTVFDSCTAAATDELGEVAVVDNWDFFTWLLS